MYLQLLAFCRYCSPPNGVMGRRIDPSCWTNSAISRSSQCSTTGVTKAVIMNSVPLKTMDGSEM